MIVYIYTFPNNKKYIGQTTQDLKARARHGEGYVESPYVYNAIKKYGWENIKIETIPCNSYEEMNQLEHELILKFHTTDSQYGYNIAEGGSNYPLTELHKQHISNSLKQFYQTSEGLSLKKKNSQRHKDYVMSRKEQFDNYLIKARACKTAQGVENSIQALNNYYQTPEHQEERRQNGLKGAKTRSKPVIVYADKECTQIVGIFQSGRAAAKALNIDHSLPSYALTHNHYAKGYYFYFYENSQGDEK